MSAQQKINMQGYITAAYSATDEAGTPYELNITSSTDRSGAMTGTLRVGMIESCWSGTIGSEIRLARKLIFTLPGQTNVTTTRDPDISFSKPAIGVMNHSRENAYVAILILRHCAYLI